MKVAAWGGLSVLLIGALAWVPGQQAANLAQENKAQPTRIEPASPSRDSNLPSSGSAPQTSSGAPVLSGRETVDDARLLTAGTGWALTRKHLLWTTSASKHWNDITPPGAKSRNLDGAFFLTPSQGWVVVSSTKSKGEGTNLLELALTSDGGKSWTTTPFALDDYYSKAYGGSAAINFSDALNGWVMLRLTSSSNFSRGILYATSDGGHTWNKLPEPPIGGDVEFVNATDGWLAGGPGGDKLYVTGDGGQSWKPKVVEPPAAATASQMNQALYNLPKFQSSRDGVLIVTHAGQKSLTSTLYRTADGGETWRAFSTLPASDAFNAEARPAYSVVSPDVVLFAPPNQAGIMVIEKGRQRMNAAVTSALPAGARITKLEFINKQEGWLIVSSGRCAGFKTQCTQETRLYATADAGQTLTDVTPAYQTSGLYNQPIEIGSDSPLFTSNGPGGSTRVSNHKGIDKCAAATVSSMQTWWLNSPYYDTNIYIGGSSRSCAQSNLNSSWVDQISAMGWGLIPTWVGPQAPCSGFASRISYDTATAQAQGANEADAASNAAAALGLTQGTIIYYDLEHYNTDASCSAAVRAFVNGWVQRMHARGNVAGVYGSPINAAADWVVANPPDAVWLAKWDDRVTVWGLSPVSDSLWFNHQRIHQYHGGHDETYGGITFNIDNNIADGPVAGTTGGGESPNLTPYQPSGWSDKIVVSNTTNTTSDSSPLRTTDTLYVDWAAINNGSAATAATFYTKLYVDGVEKASWYSDPPLNVNFYANVKDYSIGSLSAGTHTIKIVADATGTISESNESDNQYTKTITVVSPGQPNLTPYQPSSWSGKIVVSTTTGTSTDSATLRASDTLYVDWAAINNGNAATSSTFYTKLYVDGVERNSWYTDPPMDVNFYANVKDYSIGALTEGSHTIKIVTDYTNAVSETNESDNEYTKTILVAAEGQPNLTPYQPGGWSGKIVVSNTTGTTTDSSGLKTTDTLYVDWAAINNGNAATAATFYTALYVDGVEKASWYTPPPLNVNFYANVKDYSIGNLSAGTHTVKIVTDSTDAISESNESDNQFTKTITVASTGTCFTLTTNVSPSGGGTINRNVAPNCSGGGLVAAEQAAAPLQEPGVFATDMSLSAVSGRSVATEEAFKSLTAKAAAGGPVRVIVGLNLPFRPEGFLSDSAAAQSQRDNIAQAQDNLLSQLAAYKVRSVKKFPFIPYMAMEVSADGLKHLETSSDVNSIHEDVPVPPSLAESVALIGGNAAWASGYTGAGQTIAILDTGVDKTHPFLSGKVVSEACYSTNGSNSVSVCPGGASQSTSAGSGVNCSTSISGCDHGTHVAGIAAGKGASFSGVAKDAKIIAIQVFSRFDSPSDCFPGSAPCALTYTSDYILALQRVQALSGTYDIAAVNMSLGGNQYFAACDSAQAPTKAAIDNLRSVGVATVIASGNNGYTDSLGSPACISTAISVGSVDDGSSFDGVSTTADQVSFFSNSASFLSLLAPGRWITSSVPGGGFKTFPGTSMAAPHVAGAWAVLKSKAPSATVDEVFSALASTGVQIKDSRNNVTKPRIKVDAALNALGGGGGAGQYNSGTVVTLSPVAKAGYSFQSWSGCDSVSGNNCIVTMNASKTVTANFAPVNSSAPGVTTAAATAVAGSAATLNGTVNPRGAATSGWFEWGTSPSLATFTKTTVQSVGSGSAGVAISRAITGLTPNTTYYFRAAASNDSGTSKGSILSFKTTTTTTVPSLRVNSITVTEKNPGSNATAAFTVSMYPASSQTVTVKFATANGSAAAPADYTARALTTLTFLPGQTSKPVNVVVIGDAMDETNETFRLLLSSPTNSTIAVGQGVCTILDNDLPPNIAIDNATMTEPDTGVGYITFTLRLSSPSGRPVSVKYATANGTAAAGPDYTAVPLTTITFQPGQTVRTFRVAVIGDTGRESNETFFVNLSGAVNAVITDAQAMGVILNDD